jgi:hypothetical protein
MVAQGEQPREGGAIALADCSTMGWDGMGSLLYSRQINRSSDPKRRVTMKKDCSRLSQFEYAFVTFESNTQIHLSFGGRQKKTRR